MLYTIQCSKPGIVKTLRKKHTEAVRQWKKNGQVGRKPKFYEFVDSALLHSEILSDKKNRNTINEAA
jgi:hypothetical protein